MKVDSVELLTKLGQVDWLTIFGVNDLIEGYCGNAFWQYQPIKIKSGLRMTIQPAAYQHQTGSGTWHPQRVLLFSGHMIDATGRNPPRFPADKEGIVARQIAIILDQLHVGPNDLGLTQGACGGDILFAETCRQHGVKLQLLQPFEESEFIENSVIPAGADWLKRYQGISSGLATPPLAASQELGELSPDMNAYELCNLWLLASALAYGPEKLTFICLWDGGGGDGPGGTAHMVAEVKKHNGRVIWLDTRTFW